MQLKAIQDSAPSGREEDWHLDKDRQLALLAERAEDDMCRADALFERADYLNILGRHGEAVSVLESVLKMQIATLKDSDDRLARTHQRLGRAYILIGSHHAAGAHFMEALAKVEASHGEASLRAAECYFDLGRCYALLLLDTDGDKACDGLSAVDLHDVSKISCTFLLAARQIYAIPALDVPKDSPTGALLDAFHAAALVHTFSETTEAADLIASARAVFEEQEDKEEYRADRAFMISQAYVYLISSRLEGQNVYQPGTESQSLDFANRAVGLAELACGCRPHSDLARMHLEFARVLHEECDVVDNAVRELLEALRIYKASTGEASPCVIHTLHRLCVCAMGTAACVPYARRMAKTSCVCYGGGSVEYARALALLGQAMFETVAQNSSKLRRDANKYLERAILIVLNAQPGPSEEMGDVLWDLSLCLPQPTYFVFVRRVLQLVLHPRSEKLEEAWMREAELKYMDCAWPEEDEDDHEDDEDGEGREESALEQGEEEEEEIEDGDLGVIPRSIEERTLKLPDWIIPEKA